MSQYAVARPARIATTVGVTAALALVFTATSAGTAHAAEAVVGLGTATSFSVVSYSSVTNTGPSTLSGDLGVSPGTAVDGFPPGLVLAPGTIHSADPVARLARRDANRAYIDAAGRSTTANVPVELGGTTRTAGVYTGGTLEVNGPVPLVLDAEGDPDAVFIFQAASTLVTGEDSEVQLINGADACNVFWKVGSSATLGTDSAFIGTILAHTSVTATTGATIEGRLYGIRGAVTLDNNVIESGACAETAAAIPVPDADDDDDNDNGGGGDNDNGGGGGGAAGDTNDAAAGELAATGVDNVPAIIAGSSALVLGAALLAYSRRRRTSDAGSHRASR